MTALAITELPALAAGDVDCVSLQLGVDELESLDAPFDWHAFWVGAEAGAITVAVVGGAIAIGLT
ncbi:daptide-type RiPP [Parafrankia discariae]|uniref:daptide-type RiPP n=1 Tax=Parafrankia discariae TaxID=365528 RepID=UPI00036DD043|nr:daptide-type RiPP [Parafrankia discariae]